MTAVYKPGSKVQSVWEAFESGGADAAIKKAQALNLAPATIKMWVRNGNWMVPPPGERKPAKEKAQTDQAKPIIAKPPAVERRRMARSLGGRKRICMKGHPDYLGWLIREGEEQSEIIWDNGNHHSAVLNSWFELVEESNDSCSLPKRKTKEETERAIQANRGKNLNSGEEQKDDNGKSKPAKGKKAKG